MMQVRIKSFSSVARIVMVRGGWKSKHSSHVHEVWLSILIKNSRGHARSRVDRKPS